jgi:hypothetical protein
MVRPDSLDYLIGKSENLNSSHSQMSSAAKYARLRPFGLESIPSPEPS